MKTILIIDDGSASATNATHLAFNIAKHIGANLVLARIYPVKQPSFSKALQLAGHVAADGYRLGPLRGQPANLSLKEGEHMPLIEELEVSSDTEAQLIAYINKNCVWMVIKGLPESAPFNRDVKVQAVLNRISCPVMLVPLKFDGGFERLVYTADLRYCRLNVLKHLASLAQAFQADLLLAHISAKGLPHLEQNYALTLFSDEISKKIGYERLFFSNTKERDMSRAVDVMIHNMHADLLAVVHHRFHCEQLRTEGSDISVPVQVGIPVLVFPY